MHLQVIHTKTSETPEIVEMLTFDPWLSKDLGFPQHLSVTSEKGKATTVTVYPLEYWCEHQVDRVLFKIDRDFRMKRGFPFSYVTNRLDETTFFESKATEVMYLGEDSFDNPKDFLLTLNKKSSKYNYVFTVEKHPLRFRIKSSGEYVLQLSHSLAKVLGFSYPQDNKLNFPCKPDATAKFSPFIHRGIDTIFIYSDIVDNVMVGDIKAPLLLIYPFKSSMEGYNIHQEFINPSYVAVNRTSIRSIEILLRDGVGEPIPFVNGKTVVSLHFRKKNVM